MTDLRGLGIQRTNNFYVVRSIDFNGEPFQVRNSEDPTVIWGSFKTKEEATDHILAAYIKLQVNERYKVFLVDLADDLGLSEEEIRKLL